MILAILAALAAQATTPPAPAPPIAGTLCPTAESFQIGVWTVWGNLPSGQPVYVCKPLILTPQPSQIYKPTVPLLTVTLSCKVARLYLNGMHISNLNGDYTLDSSGLIVTFTKQVPGMGPDDALLVDYVC